MSTTSTASTAPWTSDYVFVNLWSEPKGHPWAYPAVYDLVRRLRVRTGIDFGPHQYRHIVPA
jgi:integrase/recombinase XerD